MADKTITVFDAELQQDVPHTLDIDQNGEIVVTSTETGRFIKFPRGSTVEEIKAHLSQHRSANTGQLPVDKIESDKAAIVDGLLADLT